MCKTATAIEIFEVSSLWRMKLKPVHSESVFRVIRIFVCVNWKIGDGNCRVCLSFGTTNMIELVVLEKIHDVSRRLLNYGGSSLANNCFDHEGVYICYLTDLFGKEFQHKAIVGCLA